MCCIDLNLYFVTFDSECVEDSDCPNNGQHYECNNNGCACIPGYSTTCIGMLPNLYSFNDYLCG